MTEIPTHVEFPAIAVNLNLPCNAFIDSKLLRNPANIDLDRIERPQSRRSGRLAMVQFYGKARR